ncbi:YALIA101S03e03444g1_1 [Yarrowia lipolytica]|nr:YALIA101S03e03444g1_1 [Yarrowia lipolytica]
MLFFPVSLGASVLSAPKPTHSKRSMVNHNSCGCSINATTTKATCACTKCACDTCRC